MHSTPQSALSTAKREEADKHPNAVTHLPPASGETCKVFFSSRNYQIIQPHVSDLKIINRQVVSQIAFKTEDEESSLPKSGIRIR